jgi:hypothetical protein
MERLGNQSNLYAATIGPPAAATTIGPPTPLATIGPAPAQGQDTPAPPQDHAAVKPNRKAKDPVTNADIQRRTQAGSARPATGTSAVLEAKAKIVYWTLAEDFGRICAASATQDPAKTQAALKTLHEHSRRLLGAGYASGMLCGTAEQLSHLIEQGKSGPGIALCVGLALIQTVPPLAAPIDTMLMLLGGAEALKAMEAMDRSAQQGDTFQAGKEAAKALMSTAFAGVAGHERHHAMTALSEAKFVKPLELPLPNLGTIRTSLTKLLTQCREGKAAAKEVLHAAPHGHGGPSPVGKAGHAAETAGQLGGHGPGAPHGHDDPQGKGGHPPASEHQPPSPPASKQPPLADGPIRVGRQAHF